MQSTVTAFEDTNQSDSEIIDLRVKCMNGFLSICSNLWLAPHRKLSNISDSDLPTNQCVKSHSYKSKRYEEICVRLLIFMFGLRRGLAQGNAQLLFPIGLRRWVMKGVWLQTLPWFPSVRPFDML